MAVKRSSAGQSAKSTFHWNGDHEVALFQAILCGSGGRKPAGISKHFQMAAIHDQLSKGNKLVVVSETNSFLGILLYIVSGMKDLTTNSIWAHLEGLYDLEAIDELENESRNPDEKEFTEFTLPKKEFLAVISEMLDSGAVVQETPNTTSSSSSASMTAAAPTPSAAPLSSAKKPPGGTPTISKVGTDFSWLQLSFHFTKHRSELSKP